MDSRLLPTGMTTVEGCTIERVGHDDVSDGQILKVGQNETCLTTGNGFQDLRETQDEEGKDYFNGYTPHLWKRILPLLPLHVLAYYLKRASYA